MVLEDSKIDPPLPGGGRSAQLSNKKENINKFHMLQSIDAFEKDVIKRLNKLRVLVNSIDEMTVGYDISLKEQRVHEKVIEWVNNVRVIDVEYKGNNKYHRGFQSIEEYEDWIKTKGTRVIIDLIHNQTGVRVTYESIDQIAREELTKLTLEVIT